MQQIKGYYTEMEQKSIQNPDGVLLGIFQNKIIPRWFMYQVVYGYLLRNNLCHEMDVIRFFAEG